MTRDDVKRSLLDWLESERRRYLELATSAGLPASIPVREIEVGLLTENSVDWGEVERHVSPVGTRTSVDARLMMIQAERGGSPKPPTDLFDVFGEGCRIWGTGRQPSEPGKPPSPEESAADLIGRTSRQYVSQLGTLERGDAASAAVLVEDLLSLVEGDHILHVTALPFAGLRPPGGGLERDGVTVRLLTPKEVAPLLDPPQQFRSINKRFGGLYFKADIERCGLLVLTRCPKTKQPQSQRAERVVLALQLLGFNPRGRGVASTYTEPGPELWGPGQTIRLVEGGDDIQDFGAGDLDAVVDLERRIPVATFTSPTERLPIALHRFRSAACESSPADAILDFVTALEALLLGENGELSFRLAVYGASYLAAGPEERREVFDALRAIYKVRSKLVHGLMNPADVGSLESLRGTARSLTGRLLVKALREGVPDSRTLEDLALA